MTLIESIEEIDYDLTETQRVEAGIAWLDDVRPQWWQELDLDSLDLGSGSHCVLGQIVGGECSKEWAGVEEYDLRAMGDAGFDAVVDHEYWPMLDAVDDLAAIKLTIPQAINRGFHISWINADDSEKRHQEVAAEYARLTGLWAAAAVERRNGT